MKWKGGNIYKERGEVGRSRERKRWRGREEDLPVASNEGKA